MQTEYLVTFKDYQAAQWLYLRRRPFSMLGYLWLYWTIPIISILNLLIYSYFRHQDLGLASSFLLNVRPFAVMGAIIPFLRIWSLRRSYAAMFPKKETMTPFTFSFDKQQFVSAIPGRSEGRMQWTAVEEFAEDKKVGLLFFARKRFIMLPKRVLPEDEWARVRALATSGSATH